MCIIYYSICILDGLICFCSYYGKKAVVFVSGVENKSCCTHSKNIFEIGLPALKKMTKAIKAIPTFDLTFLKSVTCETYAEAF